MNKKALTALVAIPLVFFAASTSQAETTPPAVSYSFEGDLTDSKNGSTITVAPACPEDPCNLTTGFGTENGDGFWEWTTSNGGGGGFTIDTNQELTTSFSYLVKFSFSEYDGYQRVIDHMNRSQDEGLYMEDDYITFYDQASSESKFIAGVPITLLVTRQATGETTGTIAVYSFNGTTFAKELEFEDTIGETIPFDSTLVPGGTELGFFYDNGSGESASSGKVFNIKLWPGVVLTPAQLEAEANAAPGEDVTEEEVTPTPEPEETSTPESGNEVQTNELAETGYDAGLFMLFAMLLAFSGFLTLRISRRKA